MTPANQAWRTYLPLRNVRCVRVTHTRVPGLWKSRPAPETFFRLSTENAQFVGQMNLGFTRVGSIPDKCAYVFWLMYDSVVS
jgi:hypothetical protein